MCHEVLPKGVNKSNPIGWFDQCEATEKSHGTYQGLGSPVCQRKLDIWIVDIGSGAQLPGKLVQALGIVFYFAWGEAGRNGFRVLTVGYPGCGLVIKAAGPQPQYGHDCNVFVVFPNWKFKFGYFP